jgi:predicted nucleic acid-binding protein
MNLIDTDILIDHFHQHSAAMQLISTLVDASDPLAISVVTLTELLAGMRPGEEEKTEGLLNLFVLLPIDEPVGRQAAMYLRAFRKSHKIDFGDALIAATARLQGAELFTRNKKHYPMDDITVTVPYERG